MGNGNGLLLGQLGIGGHARAWLCDLGRTDEGRDIGGGRWQYPGPQRPPLSKTAKVRPDCRIMRGSPDGMAGAAAMRIEEGLAPR